MNVEFETVLKQEKAASEDSPTLEFNVTIDGVVEIPTDVDDKAFFDGLFESILDYIEKHNASAGLTISHKTYKEEDEEAGVSDGRENA
jgi:hypothetical protein